MLPRGVSTLLGCIIFVETYFVAARFDENGYGYKTYEIPGRPIQFHLCGDQIYHVFVQLCFNDYGRRAKREQHDGILLWKKNALQFFKTKRRKRRYTTYSGSYNIVEECCIEGCVKEEVQEYCTY